MITIPKNYLWLIEQMYREYKKQKVVTNNWK